MRLVLMSDTHGKHVKVTVPEGDVLVHAGDIGYQGSATEIGKFGAWLAKQPHRNKILVPGNHDKMFEQDYDTAWRILQNECDVFVMIDAWLQIDNIKLWGSPYTPRFFDWAFLYDRASGVEQWAKIPEKVDVLITHGPPMGVLDQAAPHIGSEHCGCLDLMSRVRSVKPKIHVFGHIHGGYGMKTLPLMPETTFYNVSVVDEGYNVRHAPFVVDL